MFENNDDESGFKDEEGDGSGRPVDDNVGYLDIFK